MSDGTCGHFFTRFESKPMPPGRSGAGSRLEIIDCPDCRERVRVRRFDDPDDDPTRVLPMDGEELRREN
jgi:hypothetical protein